MIQMDTQNDKGINLEQASAWIDEAALRGVKLVCFPEVMNLIGRNVGEGGASRSRFRGIRQISYAGKQRSMEFISMEGALPRSCPAKSARPIPAF